MTRNFANLGGLDLTHDILSHYSMKEHLDWERYYEKEKADEGVEAYQNYMRRRMQKEEEWDRRLETEPFTPEFEMALQIYESNIAVLKRVLAREKERGQEYEEGPTDDEEDDTGEQVDEEGESDEEGAPDETHMEIDVGEPDLVSGEDVQAIAAEESCPPSVQASSFGGKAPRRQFGVSRGRRGGEAELLWGPKGDSAMIAKEVQETRPQPPAQTWIYATEQVVLSRDVIGGNCYKLTSLALGFTPPSKEEINAVRSIKAHMKPVDCEDLCDALNAGDYPVTLQKCPASMQFFSDVAAQPVGMFVIMGDVHTGAGLRQVWQVVPKKSNSGNGTTLVGRRVHKHFGSHGWHHGTVTSIGDCLFRVRYDDGDEEDLTFQELRKVIVQVAR